MAKENWTIGNIPDLKGKIAIVTGSNTGLGRETAKVLAGKNAEVILAVRNIKKGEDAIRDIKSEYPNSNVNVMELDLSSLKSIKDFSTKFNSIYKQLNLLINNAGVMMPPYSKTEDGFESQFGINHLGHFALTGHLINLLKSTPGARVINVSSGAHNWGNLEFSDLDWVNRKYNRQKSYGDSKIANLYFTFELAQKLKESDVIVAAAHPGWTATNLQRHSGLFSFFNPFFAQKPNMGALPTLRAAVDPEVKSGDYFGPNGRGEIKGYPVKVKSNELSKDEAIRKRLWKVSEELTSVKY